MPSRILIEPVGASFRVGLARGNGRTWQLADAFAVDVPAGGSVPEQAAKLRAAAGQRSVALRGDVDFVFSRRDVELREISLPPAPAADLPEMVRFAARNEFTHFGDGSLLDYVPLRGDEGSPWLVVAAVLSPAATSLARDLASELGLKLRRILVRPWCLAESVAAQLDPRRTALLVSRAGDTVDLAVFQAGKLLAPRSVRLSAADDAGQKRELADEVQRMLPLALRATGGRPVDEIAVIGDPASADLESRPAFPSVRHVQPAADPGSARRGTARGLVFAAFHGALHSRPAAALEQLDFGNPRRKVRQQTNWRRVALWSSVAAATLVGIALFGWMALSSQSRQIERLNNELTLLRAANQPQGNRPGVKQIVGEVQVIDAWRAESVDWMTELKEISERMLTPDDAIVDELTASAGKGQAAIRLEGHVTDRETGTDVKTGLTGRPYQVVPGPSVTDSKSPDYPVTFEYSLTHPVDLQSVVSAVAEAARQEAARKQTPPDSADKLKQNPAPPAGGEAPPESPETPAGPPD